MSTARTATVEDRKALLLARAELDRIRVTVAVHEIRGRIAPRASGERVAGIRPIAAMIVRVVAPLLGVAKLARWLRIASIAMVCARIVHDWRRGRR